MTHTESSCVPIWKESQYVIKIIKICHAPYSLGQQPNTRHRINCSRCMRPFSQKYRTAAVTSDFSSPLFHVLFSHRTPRADKAPLQLNTHTRTLDTNCAHHWNRKWFTRCAHRATDKKGCLHLCRRNHRRGWWCGVESQRVPYTRLRSHFRVHVSRNLRNTQAATESIWFVSKQKLLLAPQSQSLLGEFKTMFCDKFGDKY